MGCLLLAGVSPFSQLVLGRREAIEHCVVWASTLPDVSIPIMVALVQYMRKLAVAGRSRGRMVLGKPPVIFVDNANRAAEKMLRLALVTSGTRELAYQCRSPDHTAQTTRAWGWRGMSVGREILAGANE